MALEFKKLSDVESVEVVAETANVLIEEDGVIKKAPKTQVGGASSGGGFDFVIVDDNRDARLEVGSYQNIYNKLMNKEPIFGFVIKYDDGYIYNFTEFSCEIVEWEDAPSIRFQSINQQYGYYMWYVLQDDTVVLYEAD